MRDTTEIPRKLVADAPVFDSETERRIARCLLAESDPEIYESWGALRSRILELQAEARAEGMQSQAYVGFTAALSTKLND